MTFDIIDENYLGFGIIFGLDDRGEKTYKIPCSKCGRLVGRHALSLKRTYMCEYCKTAKKKKWQAVEKELSERIFDEITIQTKAEIKFDKAVQKMFEKRDDKEKYSKAIRLAKTRCELYGSIPEIFVAIELLHQGYKIIPQQKVAKYRLDFVIPDKRVVIEVDGKIFHSDQAKEAEKDFVVKNNLGAGWRILHIPTDYITKDMMKVAKYFRKVLK